MYGYIYLTENLINNKKYIGQHKCSQIPKVIKYYGGGTALKSAINKYGIENFKVTIIDTANTSKQLNELERYYIDKYRNMFGRYNMYNIQEGGHMIYNGKPRSEDTKLKSSLSNRGQKRSKECRERMSKRWHETHTTQTNNTNGNKRCMYRDNIIKYVKDEDIQNYLDNGYNFGNPKNRDRHGYKHSEETKRKLV